MTKKVISFFQVKVECTLTAKIRATSMGSPVVAAPLTRQETGVRISITVRVKVRLRLGYG